MASEALSILDNQFDRLSLTSEDGSFKCGVEQENTKYDEEFIRKWGFHLKDLYKLALKFYKDNEGKAIQFSYKEKLKLVALTKQVTVGKFDPTSTPPPGVLDVIGRDRRLAWQSLGDMSAEDAMASFVEFLDSHCHIFRPYAEAHKADLDNRRKLQMEQEERARQAEMLRKMEETTLARQKEEMQKQEAIKRQIQDALNQQTYQQFRAYAQQQFPNNPQQQDILVAQLQEKHYQQYMEQITKGNNNASEHSSFQNGDVIHSDPSNDSDHEDSVCLPQAIPVASMWTRKDLKEFKESIRKEGGDSVIKVGHGETVTVRVPTKSECTRLFWEFATDNYDIGFGVYFEWTKNPTSQVSVHVSESEDEDDYMNDDDDDDDEYGLRLGDDVERGVKMDRPVLATIVPVYRRECQEEVYAGSHAYPGQGIYHLKFDNSYSLWRSKTLYYRVYYTR